MHVHSGRKIEINVGETQFGFRSSAGRREALFSIEVLIQKYLEQRKPVYAYFIEYEKAFDNIKQDILLEQLEIIGFDSKNINIIRKLH